MQNSKIEWCDHSLNWWIGCEKISAGCKNCYAETMTKRFNRAVWGKGGTRTLTSLPYRNQPIKWNKKSQKEGIRYRVFAQSMSDTFEDRAELEAWRIELFEMIVKTPHLDWLLLTKRPEVAQKFFNDYPQFSNLDNVWLGVSVENQEQADIRIPVLLQIPAKIRFLSCEPLLGGIDLTMIEKKNSEGNPICYYQVLEPITNSGDSNRPAIDWVIVGGESGHNARPMHPDWVRSIRNQCAEAGVAFFFKQWGEWIPVEKKNDDWYVNSSATTYTAAYLAHQHIINENCYAAKVGKKKAGNLLDGKAYLEFPQSLSDEDKKAMDELINIYGSEQKAQETIDSLDQRIDVFLKDRLSKLK